MANLKDLVGRYNDANEKAKRRREAWEERRRILDTLIGLETE